MGFWGLGVFTFIANMLLLVQPIYMLQVYDRVLTAASLETLLYVSLLAGVALILLGIVDAIRNILAGRIAAKLAVAAGGEVLQASMKGPRATLGDVQPLRDLAAVRNFIAGRAIFAYLDLPFAPIFIGILYFIHPQLFWLTVAGAAVLIVLAVTNDWWTRSSTAKAGERSMAASLAAQSFVRNSETLNAMGMVGNVTEAWGKEEAASLQSLERANLTNAIVSGISRALRMALQLAILGYGGYLVLQQEMTAGMIFASAIISGRGLQPIDQVIGGWRNLTDTLRADKRLRAALGSVNRSEAMSLPAPAGRIDLENVVVFPPNNPTGDPLLKRVTASIPAGSFCVVLGPSGAGKTTLMRAAIGAIEPRSGVVRIDGADIRSRDLESLGRHVGYLAQNVDLLPGTVAQNIARFDAAADPAEIVNAAELAQVHQLILTLPSGYDTRIGPGGAELSGGQKQRIGLARAMFGKPSLLFLDEPNASLDLEGERALERALAAASKSGTTLLIVTQRPAIVDHADLIMIMREGAVEDFGPRLEVLARQKRQMRATKFGADSGAPLASARFGQTMHGAVTPAE
ncbi:MAG: type I secretion system permease/ATPase [Aliihoeflea sp.]